MNIENVSYKELKIIDINDDMLKYFNRYEKIDKIYYLENGKLYLKEMDNLEDDWNTKDKIHKIKDMRTCINEGGAVFGAYMENKLIGFTVLRNKWIGANNDYLILWKLYVSYEKRNNGIGKNLFSLALEEAKKRGAKKLFISASDSENAQEFYKSIGCTLASESFGSEVESESYDILMEKIIN